ncbi:uncharacterized protein [Embiotoca jacksoni]|uniref:uncharacterized protein isoform X2 n=1 Tax=Embiotoca jacksoni TaxID=100190 RepID=UPI003703BCA2
MAADAQLFFLLFALISNIQAEERLEWMDPGDYYTFKPPKEANFCLISKLAGEDKFVLWNTSDPSTENSTVPEDLKQRLHVETWQNVSSYTITDLTPSDSGRYQEECWTDGNVTHEANIRIIVCDQQHQTKSVDVSSGGTSEIPCDGAAENLTVQWIYFDVKKDKWTKVFEDGGTLVVNHEKGTLQKMENTSALRVSNFTTDQIGESFVCLVMNQHQCVSSQILDLNVFPEIIYHSVEETAVLPCPVTDVITDQPPSWKKINYKLWVSDNKLFDHGSPEFEDIGQNSSLVFSPLMLNHSVCFSLQKSCKAARAR